MTYRKLMMLYRHFKNDYDFRLKHVSYSELEDMADHDGEFIRD